MIGDRLRPSDRLAVLVVAGLAVLPTLTLEPFHLSFLMLLVMYAALSIGWNVLGGYAGYQSFGHVAFLGVGGYTSVWLLTEYGLEPFLTAPLGALVAGLVALVVGYPCLRLKGPYFALVTLIVALAVEIAVSNLPGLNATSGIFLPSPLDSAVFSQVMLYELMVGVLLVTVVAARLVERSRYGMGLSAIREDEEVASTQGIDTTRLKLGAFVLSAALAGLAGGIYAWFLGYVTPAPMFDVRISILVVLIALLGGTRSWIGPFVGAVILRAVDQALVLQFGGQTAQIMYGLLLVVVILYLPEGVLPYLRRTARDVLPRRVRRLGHGGESS
jgi:branched-chain amino acid transport system permease protein